MLAILAAALVAAGIASFIGRGVNLVPWLGLAVVLLPVWLLVGQATGIYRVPVRHISVDMSNEIGPAILGTTAWIWIFLLLWAPLSSDGISLAAPSVLWASAAVLIPTFRAASRKVAKRRGWNRRSIVVIGSADDVLTVMQRTDRHPEWGLDIAATVLLGEDGDFRLKVLGEEPPPEPELGEVDATVDDDPSALAEAVIAVGADRALLAGGIGGLRATTTLIRDLVERGFTVDYVPGGPETLYTTATLHHLEGLPVLSVTPTAPGPVASIAKRLVDIAISSVALVVASPILAWAAIRIKHDSPGPVLFRQERPGLNGEPFTILKLRTMVDGAEREQEELREKTLSERGYATLFKLKDDPRVTRFGETLRATSLDELPQLWNVLRGDMSIVGPRPVLFEETAQVPHQYAARASMKPGICGPWQALGRSDIPFDDMVRLDYTYVVGWSLAEDFRLILRTALAVLRSKGAY